MNTKEKTTTTAGGAGFTLLEATVAIGIFAVLMVLAVGITLSVLNAQKKVASIQSVIDNVRLSVEVMTREMRTGINFSLVDPNSFSPACPNPMASQSGIQFTDVNQNPPQRRFYYLANNYKIMRVALSSDSAIDDCLHEARPFTADDVLVDNLNMLLTGATTGPDDGQPRITISLKARSKSPKTQLETMMRLQTTVVPRLRDL